jgi:hypothetical protein
MPGLDGLARGFLEPVLPELREASQGLDLPLFQLRQLIRVILTRHLETQHADSEQ